MRGHVAVGAADAITAVSTGTYSEIAARIPSAMASKSSLLGRTTSCTTTNCSMPSRSMAKAAPEVVRRQAWADRTVCSMSAG